MVVAVFGDIDPEEALAVVKKHFGELKADPGLQQIQFKRPNAIPKSVVRHKKIGKDTGMVMLGYPAPSIFDKEQHAAVTVLNAIMAGYGYPGGWLHEELRGEGLVYYVQAFPMTGPVPGYFTIISQTRPDKVGEVVSRIERNVQRAKEGRISEDEFRTAVQRLMAFHAQQNTAIGQQAQEAAVDELFGLGYDYRKTFDTRIEAVKLKDVVEAARRYLGEHVSVTSSPEDDAR
jgi:zinc protease